MGVRAPGSSPCRFTSRLRHFPAVCPWTSPFTSPCLCLLAAVQGRRVRCLLRVPGDREWRPGPWDVALSESSAGSDRHHESTRGARRGPGGPRMLGRGIGTSDPSWWEPPVAPGQMSNVPRLSIWHISEDRERVTIGRVDGDSSNLKSRPAPLPTTGGCQGPGPGPGVRG